jgi:thiamine-phosphate pyrophosphorylase
VPGLGDARLYAITPDREPEQIVKLVDAVLEGGADVVQLRHKTLARGDIYRLACRIQSAVHDARRLLIVNDYLDVALLSGADGVHLGADDIPVAEARRLAPVPFLIGASAGTPEAARAAVRAGADYIGCGPTFSTPVKSSKAPIGPQGVSRVAAAVVGTPVFAIGGIDVGNVHLLTAAGIDRVCVIRGLADAGDPAAAAHAIRGALEAVA